ncbi:MAG: M23 family metallopeptidase [Acidobacteria bacterium]|nr:M23 family metallopeptidase [Acidobacteriota bacterium]
MPDYGLREPSYLGGSGRSFLRAVPVLMGLGAIGALGYLWAKSTAPMVEVMGGFPRALGPSTPLHVRWTNPHGARRVAVFVEQGGARTLAFERTESPRRFAFRRPPEGPGQVSLAISKKEVPALAAGKAVVVVEVQSNDLRGLVERVSHELPVVLEQPSVTADKETVFVKRGRTGVVQFTVGGGWSEAGVRVGRFTFPSWPMKGHAGRRISLFTVPPESGGDIEPLLFARSPIGDEVTAPFPLKVTEVKFRERTLELGDKLMDKVLGELDPGARGDAAERFARINSAMRRANDAALAELAAKSEGKRRWEGPFVLLPRGKAEALFADHRTYKYGGKALNREWHLGIDMASVKRAPVPAANRGRVVFAGRLGIYGNCVAIDHGMGVLTIYGHMSEIGAKEGDTVAKGQEIGKSGMSGLAGGDHLHLGMMVGSAFVDPVEWTHESWMKETLKDVE